MPGNQRYEATATSLDGRSLVLDVVLWSVEDEDEGLGFHVFMTDISGRKQSELELRRANDDLANFSAAMAHDLRTPLTVVKGFASMLRGNLEGRREEEFVARIEGAADRGSRLIDDILAFAQIGREALHREPVDLTTLAEHVSAEHVVASDRRADVRVEPLPRVPGDEALLRTMLSNFVGNAIKYVPDDRDPAVVVDSVLDEATGKWGIRVNRVELKGIDPPPSIKDSMEKQMRADRDKRALILTAEGERQSAILTAEGQKQSAILTAEGDRESQILRAQADRESQILRAQGEGQAIQTVFQAIHDGRPDQSLLAYQYLQMMPKIAEGDANKVWIVPSEIGKALEGLGSTMNDLKGIPQEVEGPLKRVDMGPIEPKVPETAGSSGSSNAAVQAAIEEAARAANPGKARAEAAGSPKPAPDAAPSTDPSTDPAQGGSE